LARILSFAEKCERNLADSMIRRLVKRCPVEHALPRGKDFVKENVAHVLNLIPQLGMSTVAGYGAES
ncbi:MAG: hypothetical protein ACXVIJ_10000, partial [Thermoanaerobaculia bacterium]